MSWKPGDGFTDERIVEIAQKLYNLQESGAWQDIVDILNDEAISALKAGIFDMSRPREYYGGYVVGLEFLAGLPQNLAERAQAIADKKEAEAQAGIAEAQASVRRSTPYDRPRRRGRGNPSGAM